MQTLYHQLKKPKDKLLLQMLCIAKTDIDDKVCFITAYEIYRALRDLFPTMDVDCFIAKPIGKRELVSRIKEELKNR